MGGIDPRPLIAMSAYWASDTSQHVNFTGSDGHVHQLVIGPGHPSWANYDLTPQGSPDSYTLDAYWGSDNSQHINYVSLPDRHVHELYMAPGGTQWANNDLTQLSGGGICPAAGSVLHAYWGSDSSQHVNFAGTDGHVHELYIHPGANWVNNDLTQISGGGVVPAAYSALTGYWGSDSSQHVNFIGTDGHVHELYIRPGANWVNNDLTQMSGGGILPATGSALDAYWGSDSSQHVNFVGTDGHVHELYVHPGASWVNNDLTQMSGGGISAAAYSALDAYWGSDSSQHVNFIGTDGHVHELYVHPGANWVNNDLSLMSSALRLAPPAGSRSSLNLSYCSPFCAVPGTAYLDQSGQLVYGQVCEVIQSTLWRTEYPFSYVAGKGPPTTLLQQVDGNVMAFQPLDANDICVLGMDNNLWLEHSVGGSFGQIPPPREQIDGNVIAFEALDTNTIYVLGADASLWLEHSINGKFGQLPPPREQVDGSVSAFQALDVNTVCVLGSDGNLWLEHSVSGKFGQIPPPREQVDSEVMAFQAIDANTIYVLGADGNLWLEHSVNGKFGQMPPPREQVDNDVAAFQAIDANNVYVLGEDGVLWQALSVNGKFGQVPPSRLQIDTDAQDFQGISPAGVYVLGGDGNLWLETEPYGAQGPAPRTQIAAGVDPVAAFGTLTPAYMLLTLVYAPPGANGGKTTSQVTYGQTTVMGTTTSITNTSKEATQLKLSGGNAGDDAGVSISGEVDFSVSKSTTNTSQVQVTKTVGSTLAMSGPSSDGIDHDYDRFYLWLNPVLSVSIDRNNNMTWMPGTGGNPATCQFVEVLWLKNPSQMPAGTKQLLDAAGLTHSDYDALLKVNPFSNGPVAVDPARYQLVQNGNIDYEPSDTPGTQSYNFQSTTSTTQTRTTEVDSSVSVTVSESVKALVFSESASATLSFSWTNTSTTSTNTQSTQTVTAQIGEPATGYAGPTTLWVYWDTVYNTLLFVLGN
jgi:hypothetical protein